MPIIFDLLGDVYNCPSATSPMSECQLITKGGAGTGTYSWTIPGAGNNAGSLNNTGLNILGLNSQETLALGIILVAAVILFAAGIISAPVLLAALGLTALGYLALTSLNGGYNAINNAIVQPLKNLGSNISQGLQNLGLPSSIANGFNLIIILLVFVLAGYGGYLIYKNL